MHPFSTGISRLGNLPLVFREVASTQNLSAIRDRLQKKGKLLISDKNTGCIQDVLEDHASYIRDWLKIFTIYEEKKENPPTNEVPIWWRAGWDDIASALSIVIDNDLSFESYYAQYNRLYRRNTRILADSRANVALALDSDEKGLIVPLYLSIFADAAQPENIVGTASVSEKGLSACIPYPAINSILDVYSNKNEATPSSENEGEQPQLSDKYVKSWHSAIETGVQQGFALYQKMVFGDRRWPEKLYFRWAIDLSQLYDMHYAKPESNQEGLIYHIELKDRLVGGGSGGAAFALAAAQALARADRRGEFSVSRPHPANTNP